MLLLSALALLAGSHLAHAAEAVSPARDPEISEEGRLELQQLLEDETAVDAGEVEPGNAERKPAVLGAATSEPSDRRELYLDYSDSNPEPSVESQR